MACVQGSRTNVQFNPLRLQAVKRPGVVARSYQGPPPRRDGFWTGFALGGAICGAAGFFFAPQKFKTPNWFEENKPPVTKQELEDKIDQLHAAINDVANQVAPDDTKNNSGSSPNLSKINERPYKAGKGGQLN